MELIVAFDFGLDLYITYHLIESPNTMWAAGTVLGMITPMYACLVQMIEFMRSKNLKTDSEGCKLECKSNWLAFSSVMSFQGLFFLCYIIFMDLAFMLIRIVLEPFALLLGCCKIKHLSWFIEWTYDTVFFMERNEVIAFRRMRTLTQLCYETLI